ncbi:MAG: FmdB family zinc ribbon protein [Methylophilaceae bacterium]
MPIYEYRCTSCGVEKEMLRKINDAPLKVCPDCGKETFIKQVSAAGFQLKGSGWYASDFKGSGKPPANATASEAAPAPVASSPATPATNP